MTCKEKMKTISLMVYAAVCSVVINTVHAAVSFDIEQKYVKSDEIEKKQRDSRFAGLKCDKGRIKSKIPGTMEDRAIACSLELPSGIGYFYGVYDGHGGQRAVEIVQQILHLQLKNFIAYDKYPDKASLSYEYDLDCQRRKALVNAFMSTEEMIKRIRQNNFTDEQFRYLRNLKFATSQEQFLRAGGDLPEILKNRWEVDGSGTCVLTALVEDDYIWVAHAGDCRAVLKSQKNRVRAITEDHDLSREDELKRIATLSNQGVYISQGGYINKCTLITQGKKVEKVYDPSMNVTRSLGHGRFLCGAVIPTPEIFSAKLCDEDDFLILASDGLWGKLNKENLQVEFGITNEAACKIVSDIFDSGQRDTELVADTLIKAARSAGSDDNIAVLVIDLKAHLKGLAK
jgi:protein phosphatase 2C